MRFSLLRLSRQKNWAQCFKHDFKIIVRFIIPQCAHTGRERANVLSFAVHNWVCVYASAVCMTTAIIILGRWSDLTPTNYVWPASQDRVPSVWCCLTPHRLVNEGASWGSKGGVCWWKGEGAVLKGGWRGPPSLLLLLRSVPDQLLIHSSFTKTTNGGHTRAQAGQDVGSKAPSCPSSIGLISTLLLQKQSSSSPSLLFLPLSVARRFRLLALHYPVTLFHPAPLTCSSGTNRQLSQARSGASAQSYNTSRCSATAAIYLAADAKVDKCLTTALWLIQLRGAEPTCFEQPLRAPYQPKKKSANRIITLFPAENKWTFNSSECPKAVGSSRTEGSIQLCSAVQMLALPSQKLVLCCKDTLIWTRWRSCSVQ